MIWTLIDASPDASSSELWFEFKRRAVRAGLAFELSHELGSYVDVARARYAIRQIVEAGVEGPALADKVAAQLQYLHAIEHPDLVDKWIQIERRRFRKLQTPAASATPGALERTA